MDELVSQIGLLLSQLRFARRALEDIERSTARYSGVTFAVAVAAGPKFGEPPLLSGALKVYVTNINDLTIGRGGVGLFEGLLGGIGRFFGGLAGGFAGGIIGGVSLWVWVGKLQDIVKGINTILDRLGLRGAETGGTAGAKGKTEGTDLTATLQRLNPILESLTALFDAAASGPKDAGKTAAEGMSEEAKGWGEQLRITLQSATETLTALDKVVKGLTIFVPLLTAAIADLLVRLDDMKIAILSLLQFALRVVLLLRGVALVTIYDTVSAIAKLGVSILDILKTAVKTILEAILAMVGAIFNTFEALIRFIGAGLKSVMDSLLLWLVNGLGRVLTYIGDLRIFRLLVHLVQVLPNMLPALITLVYGDKASIGSDSAKWLEEIKGKTVPGPTGPALTGGLPDRMLFPDIGEQLAAKMGPFKDSLKDTSKILPEKADQVFTAARNGFAKIDATMQDALTRGETDFNKKLSGDIETVRKQANQMADALTPAVDAASDAAKKAEKDEGLQKIAKAYRDWLQSDGLKTVLSQITTYFASGNATDLSGPAAVPAKAVSAVQPEAPKATVDIGELIIDLKPAKPAPASATPSSKPLSLWHDDLLPGYDERLERMG